MPVRPPAPSVPLPPGDAARSAGHAVGRATGPRPIATTGRAHGPGRAPDSWEHVMPWGETTEAQRRLLAAAHAARAQAPAAGVRR